MRRAIEIVSAPRHDQIEPMSVASMINIGYIAAAIAVMLSVQQRGQRGHGKRGERGKRIGSWGKRGRADGRTTRGGGWGGHH